MAYYGDTLLRYGLRVEWFELNIDRFESVPRSNVLVGIVADEWDLYRELRTEC
jgi:hypothetical protein